MNKIDTTLIAEKAFKHLKHLNYNEWTCFQEIISAVAPRLANKYLPECLTKLIELIEKDGMTLKYKPESPLFKNEHIYYKPFKKVDASIPDEEGIIVNDLYEAILKKPDGETYTILALAEEIYGVEETEKKLKLISDSAGWAFIRKCKDSNAIKLHMAQHNPAISQIGIIGFKADKVYNLKFSKETL